MTKPIVTPTPADAPLEPGAPLAPGVARLRFQARDGELLLEGSEDFVRGLLPALLDRLGSEGVAAPAPNPEPGPEPEPTPAQSGPRAGLAGELGIAVDRVDEALGPTPSPPWVHVDPGFWSTFKARSPAMGATAPTRPVRRHGAPPLVPPARSGAPTLADVRATVRAAGLTTKNASRLSTTASPCSGGGSRSPSAQQRLRARRIVRAFCLQEALGAE